jgi:hypothetical protein
VPHIQLSNNVVGDFMCTTYYSWGKKKRTDTRAVCDGLKVGACLRMEEQVRDRVAGEVSVQ